MADIIILCPTRGRPGAAVETQAAFDATATPGLSDLIFVVDEDDPSLPEYSALGVHLLMVRRDEGGNMVKALNVGAKAIIDFEYDAPPTYLGFMGDDHRLRTPGWDALVVEDMGAGTGFVYGDDLAQRERLPTAIFIRTSIVAALGWMAPPWLRHLYVDNSWLVLGRALDAITYDPRIVIEHIHPSFGKGVWDDNYRRVNAPEMYSHDGDAFGAWVEDGVLATVDIVRGAL